MKQTGTRVTRRGQTYEFSELVRTALTPSEQHTPDCLTMLGIIIGITAVILILIISQGATAYVNGQFHHSVLICCFRSSDVIKLTVDDAKAIANPGQISNVAEVGERLPERNPCRQWTNTSVNVIGFLHQFRIYRA